MATRRENGMGSMLRRKQRNDNSSPYKRRQPAPANNKLQSSSSLSSFLSFISGAFRRKAPERAEPESDQSEDEETTGTDLDEQPDSDPELGPRPGRRIERDNGAADTLSRLGQSLQQSISLPKVLPASSILPPTDHSEMKSSATTSHIAPPTRPRRSVQPSFATAPRSTAKRSTRPSFPGGIGSYGGFSATAEPSPPPFTPNNPLENSFAANRPPPSSKFTFTAKLPSANTKTSSEVLAEFFAAKGKAPLTAEERKLVARLIAESDAESSKSQSPDTDPYNGVPSFSFLKATFPAPERDSTSPSSSLPASESAPSIGSSVAPRKRRPINYGGPKRSAAITKAGFTLREHQKLLEKQKATQENVAPDMSNVGDKRGVRDTEEDGGGKRRRTNDGQSAPVEEPAAKGGVAKLLSLSAQPSMPSPLRQMTKLNSPSPPRVAPRAQAPSPASPLSRVTPEDAPTPKPASTKPAQTPAKPKPRKSLVADVMRDMLAEDKAREKQEKPVDTTVFSNPYEESALPVVTAPKVRKPRRTSARPATKSSATVAKQENKPMSLIEKIEQTDVRPSAKKPKTEVEAPPPTFTFTAASPKDVTPKARRPAPVVEEPSAPTESSEIEVIDLDEEPKHKSPNSASNGRPSLSVDVVNNSNGGSKSNTMLGLPHRQRPSFSLHSPARPSPLREMSVPIEDDEDEIVEIPGPTGVPVTNGFTTSNSFPFSNGFSTNTSSSIFSAPVPPPAPTLAPAQLPNKTQAPKIDAPLFGSSKSLPKSDAPSFFAAPKPAEPKPAEPKPDVPSFFAAPKPVEPKADVPSFFKVPKPAEPAPAPAPVVEAKSAPAPVIEKPAPAPVPEVKPTTAPAPVAAPKPLSETELKTSAQSLPVSALPVFTFTAPIVTSTPKTAESRAAADLPVSKLPTFTFGSLAPAPAAKTPSFNWSAAGFKATAASGTWTCGTCMLSNPASATEKCTVCDAKKPGASTESAPAPSSVPAPVPATKTASFDWGAAGMKAPTAPSGGSWTCSTCSLSNPASATEKCTVCDAKKPGAAPATKTASFDWGAAGMKAPSAAAGGSWTCSTCSLSNPATATEKCTVCDAKRPGAAPPAKTASFNWSAAGLKAPSSTGGWTCSTCGLSNTDAAATKCSICDATR